MLTNKTTNTIRIALATVLATTLVACEDNTPPTTKARLNCRCGSFIPIR